MQILPDALRVGSVVRVRRSRWRIVDIRSYERCQILTLAGLSPPNERTVRRFITPFDRLQPLTVTRPPLRTVRARTWRRACRALLAADCPAGGLRAAARAQIDVLPHQLEPALAIVGGQASRILLADEVGLGKTIQAGLVIGELIARRAIDRVLILTPAGLRDQWNDELHRRFALTPSVVDARAIARLSAGLPRDVNPWMTMPIAIASIELVKRPEVLAAVSAAHWDLVVVDEAHGAATAVDRHAAADALCSRAAYAVAITATPHNGDEEAYESLRRIGSTGDPLIVFRRTRRDVGLGSTRRLHVLTVRRSIDERRVDDALSEYSAAVRRERGEAWLALSVLHKRMFSSAWSLAESVDRRLQMIAPAAADGPAQIPLPLLDLDGDFSPDDQPPCWPADLSLSDTTLERRLLTTLAAAARRAAACESKISALVRLLQRVDDRVIVFTEYRDTLEHVCRAIGPRTVVLHGGMSRADRAGALARFAREPRAVLLATDAAGEGLNLQDACRFIVNLELPWNPVRLEQRIGRVDRIGQRRTVHACHLVARGTGEAAILERLRRRLLTASAAMDVPDPLGSRAEERIVAHLVVTGKTAEDVAGPPARGVSPRPTEPRAIEEGRRIAELRRVGAVSSDAADEGGRLLLVSRRWQIRRTLGSDVVTLWRVTAENADAAVVAERVVPVRLNARRRPSGWRRAELESLIDAVTPAILARITETTARWRDECATVDAAFRSARVARERAIAERLHQPRPAPLQAGLFDRRADRARAAAAALQSTCTDRASERIARFLEPIARWSVDLALIVFGR